MTAATPWRVAARTAAAWLAGCLWSLAQRASDQVLHPLRRRVARHALQGRGLPGFTLVICHGNLCRSPYAAGALRRLLSHAAGTRIASAGFARLNRPSPPAAVAAAARRGVDLSHHRSTPLVADAVQAADLVVVMDAAQRRAICRLYGRSERDIVVLGDLDPARVETRAIRDPLNQAPEVFQQSYARVDRCLAELVRALEAGARQA